MNSNIPKRVKDMTGIITENGIHVISFDKIKNGEAYWNCECPICYNDLIIEKTHFLLTQENEDEYYRIN